MPAPNTISFMLYVFSQTKNPSTLFQTRKKFCFQKVVWGTEDNGKWCFLQTKLASLGWINCGNACHRTPINMCTVLTFCQPHHKTNILSNFVRPHPLFIDRLQDNVQGQRQSSRYKVSFFQPSLTMLSEAVLSRWSQNKETPEITQRTAQRPCGSLSTAEVIVAGLKLPLLLLVHTLSANTRSLSNKIFCTQQAKPQRGARVLRYCSSPSAVFVPMHGGPFFFFSDLLIVNTCVPFSPLNT